MPFPFPTAGQRQVFSRAARFLQFCKHIDLLADPFLAPWELDTFQIVGYPASGGTNWPALIRITPSYFSSTASRHFSDCCTPPQVAETPVAVRSSDGEKMRKKASWAVGGNSLRVVLRTRLFTDHSNCHDVRDSRTSCGVRLFTEDRLPSSPPRCFSSLPFPVAQNSPLLVKSKMIPAPTEPLRTVRLSS